MIKSVISAIKTWAENTFIKKDSSGDVVATCVNLGLFENVVANEDTVYVADDGMIAVVS